MKFDSPAVVTKLATRLRVSVGRPQKDRQQRDSGEEHVRRQPGESHAPVRCITTSRCKAFLAPPASPATTPRVRLPGRLTLLPGELRESFMRSTVRKEAARSQHIHDESFEPRLDGARSRTGALGRRTRGVVAGDAGGARNALQRWTW